MLAVVGVVTAAVVLARLLSDGFSARPAPSALEARLALALRKVAVPARYEDMKNPVSPNAEVLRGAMEHWADHCATCHANDGGGRTEIGQNMYPRPPDMRAATTQQMSDGELYYVINQGIRFSGMPAWGKSGDDDRASWELVAFIRTLPSLTAAQLEAMKAMNPVPASAVKTKQHENDLLNEDQPHTHEGH